MRLLTVDAFTDRPFAGNPAAVAVLDAAPGEAWMRALAAEMNLSETAFVVPRAEGAFDLRWLTPTVEVDLCGHATLAAAHVLWTLGLVDASREIAFETRSGRLACQRDARGWIAMDFPSTPPEASAPPDGLADALGATLVWTGRSRFDAFVRLADADTVRTLAPDLGALASLDARGVIVTAPGDGAADFVSRFFAPAAGVPEDPVTGSAHCALAPYWASEFGRDALVGHQVSARGGVVEVEARGARVTLRGQAVTMFELVPSAAVSGPDARCES